jgi:gamma-glutamyltranspeptidase/glutathione hydrolase
MKIMLALAAAIAAVVPTAAIADFGVVGATPGPGDVGRGDRYAGRVWATRSPVIAQHGMVATAHPLASQVAIDILKKGGSAMDAAIAANAALGLMEPVSCGIGGDLFAIVWDPKTRRLYGYNASGTAPAGRDLTKMIEEAKAAAAKKGVSYDARVPLYGSLSVTVPGAVDGWFALQERFGKLTMRDDLAPAISYARDGFPVTQLIAQTWRRVFGQFEANHAIIEDVANAKATYLIDGHVPVEGEVFRNPDLAETYEALAREGRDAYYRGGVAKTADAYFRRIGGDLRYADFANFKGEWVEPLSVPYHGYDVFELPPNSQGMAVLQMLRLLEPYDLKAMGAGSLASVSTMLEAKRVVYEDMAKFYGDPRFAHIPVAQLLSKDYADRRRKLMHPERPNPDIPPGNPQFRVGDTTYLTVADKDGMMVSFIQSNYSGMGSGLVPDHLGFMFHNRGNLFSLDRRSPNVYAPGKRPFHTLIPGFVMKDGEPFLSFGVMGGDMQAQGQLQLLVNIIDLGMNIQDAGDAARWYHGGDVQVTGEKNDGLGTVAIESGYSASVRNGLKAKGYKVITPGWEYGADEFGGYQAIMRDKAQGTYWGATEMRKDGEAIGY